MSDPKSLTIACMLMCLLTTVDAGEFDADAARPREVAAFVENYCSDCHNKMTAEAGVHLTGNRTHLDLLRERKLWLRALGQVHMGTMPPEGDAPEDEEREAFVDHLDAMFNRIDWQTVADPGRQSMARLMTIEYRNSVRDLFDVDLDAGVYLQRDPEGQTGFTNDRSGLSFSPKALEVYFKEAERAVDAVMGNSISRVVYDFAHSNIKRNHHELSHHRNDPDKIVDYNRVTYWFAQQAAYLLDRISQIQEARGSLLDNSLVLYGSGMEDGNVHEGKNIPVALFGGGGTVRTGQRLRCPPGSVLANLHLSLLRIHGIEAEDFNGVAVFGVEGLV